MANSWPCRSSAKPSIQLTELMRVMTCQKHAATPKLARQMDSTAAAKAHAELIRYLRPLGASARWQEGALNVAAAVMLGLLLVGAIAVWIMVRRGLV